MIVLRCVWRHLTLFDTVDSQHGYSDLTQYIHLVLPMTMFLHTRIRNYWHHSH